MQIPLKIRSHHDTTIHISHPNCAHVNTSEQVFIKSLLIELSFGSYLGSYIGSGVDGMGGGCEQYLGHLWFYSTVIYWLSAGNKLFTLWSNFAVMT